MRHLFEQFAQLSVEPADVAAFEIELIAVRSRGARSRLYALVLLDSQFRFVQLVLTRTSHCLELDRHVPRSLSEPIQLIVY